MLGFKVSRKSIDAGRLVDGRASQENGLALERDAHDQFEDDGVDHKKEADPCRFQDLSEQTDETQYSKPPYKRSPSKGRII
jgi:hypothetical protein